jgi:hypothetical protein
MCDVTQGPDGRPDLAIWVWPNGPDGSPQGVFLDLMGTDGHAPVNVFPVFEPDADLGLSGQDMTFVPPVDGLEDPHWFGDDLALDNGNWNQTWEQPDGIHGSDLYAIDAMPSAQADPWVFDSGRSLPVYNDLDYFTRLEEINREEMISQLEFDEVRNYGVDFRPPGDENFSPAHVDQLYENWLNDVYGTTEPDADDLGYTGESWDGSSGEWPAATLDSSWDGSFDASHEAGYDAGGCDLGYDAGGYDSGYDSE